MISMISTYLSLLLLKEQIITADDEEIYKYGFEITIANMVNGTAWSFRDSMQSFRVCI